MLGVAASPVAAFRISVSSLPNFSSANLAARDYLVLIADIALEGNEVLAQLLCTLKVATYADNVGALRYELLCRGEAMPEVAPVIIAL